MLHNFLQLKQKYEKKTYMLPNDCPIAENPDSNKNNKLCLKKKSPITYLLSAMSTHMKDSNEGPHSGPTSVWCHRCSESSSPPFASSCSLVCVCCASGVQRTAVWVMLPESFLSVTNPPSHDDSLHAVLTTSKQFVWVSVGPEDWKLSACWDQWQSSSTDLTRTTG